jgi:hypothetical protein
MRRCGRAFRFLADSAKAGRLRLCRRSSKAGPRQFKEEKKFMKRSIVYTGIAFGMLLQGLPKPAGAQIPSAETNVAPAAASLEGVTYVAWKGKNTPGSVWYSSANGSGWNTQQQITFAKTTHAPALAALSDSDTLYLAWRGQSTNPTDKIFYSTTTLYASGWSAQATVCNGSTCAQTTAAPALAASSSTLYVAWTTSANTIGVASNAGSWNFSLPQPVATPYPGTAPALAVYDGTLFLAWVQEEPGTACGSSQCFQMKYATLPLSGGAWSAAAATTASSSIAAAPALAVYLSGLYLAWTPASGTLDYADWDDGSWGTPVVITGLPIPPGPLTPALVFNALVTAVCPNPVYAYSFDVVYAAPVSGETYDDIYSKLLFSQTEGRCTCKGTTCQ